MTPREWLTTLGGGLAMLAGLWVFCVAVLGWTP